MRLFLKHATEPADAPPAPPPAAAPDAHLARAAQLVEVNCDEAALDDGQAD